MAAAQLSLAGVDSFHEHQVSSYPIQKGKMLYAHNMAGMSCWLLCITHQKGTIISNEKYIVASF